MIVELDPGAIRELHWDPTADEWQYVIEGDISVTVFGSHGRYRTEMPRSGDVGYIPQGYGHSIENVGNRPCRVLVGFNTGIYETIDLSQWIAGNPVDVLAANFGKPTALFERLPRRALFIAPEVGSEGSPGIDPREGGLLMEVFKVSVATPCRIAIVATRGFALTAGLLAAAIVVQAAEDDAELLAEAQGIFKPLPKDMATPEFPLTPDRVSLGRKLFFDPRVSVDGTVSCARCHQSSLYATDGLANSHGAFDKPLPRNAPTVLNAALQFKQHWDGTFENVEEQAKRSLLGPGFANPDYAAAMARVKAIHGYSEMFSHTFPGEVEPVTQDNWGKAIGAYERTLVSPSRFDGYLGGKIDALSTAERKGLRTFIDTGCVNCHGGAGVGGGKFRKFGIVDDYWKSTHSREADKGRFNLTKDPKDMHVFKVASLRNALMTPPYFHDGSVGTLPEAVRIMAKVQLGTDLSDQDTSEVVAFLGSLNGELPEDFATAPVLPPAGFGSTSPASGDQTTR